MRVSEGGASSQSVHEPVELRLDEVVRRRAERTPDAVAIEMHRGQLRPVKVTWAVINEGIDRQAEEIATLELAPGSRVAVVLADTVACLEVIFGLFRLGLVLVPVDSRWGERLRENIVAMSGASGRVICDVDGRVDVGRLDPDPQCAAPLDREVALISYTSGSTSDPKGVVLRHRHLREVYAAGVRSLLDLGVERPERYGNFMRMSGLGVLGVHYFFALEFGATTVVLPELNMTTAAQYWEMVQAHEVDMTYLVPALLEMVLRRSRPAGERVLTAMCGGAPMREEAQREVQDRFPVVVLNAYGATEMGFAVFFGDRDPSGRGTHAVGRPALGEARIRADNGTLLDGVGQGELELRGPSRSDGYWMNDVANAEAFDGDWYRTGDIVFRDERGRYFHRGRLREIVLRGGFTIYLSEVEDALLAAPGVEDACAVRLRGGAVGEDVGAIVRGNPEATPSAVLAACHTYLGPDRSPRRVLVVGEPIPRVPNGKVDRRAAEELWRKATNAAAEEGR